MGGVRQKMLVACITAMIILQGCALGPEPYNTDEKQAVLERWTRCLQRFETNSAHYCEGHRRDILSLYPTHLHRQVEGLLRKKTKTIRVRSLVKTRLRGTPGTVQPSIRDTRPEQGTKAE